MTNDLPFLDAATLAALDRFIDKSDEPPTPRLSREEAVNVVVQDWLMAQGYMPIPQEPGETVETNEAAVPAAHVLDDTKTTFGEEP
jgi:hypothetical protein